MSAEAILRRTLRDARRRVVADTLALAAPWLGVACVLAWRLDAPAWGLLAALGVSTAAGAIAWRRAQRLDPGWLASTLDRRRPDLEDSTTLLLGGDARLSPLQQLQAARLRQRIQDAPAPDLRAPWRLRWLAGNLMLAAAAVALVLMWPAPAATTAQAPPRADAAPERAAPLPRLTGAWITVTPPAYTGLPERRVRAQRTRVPERSRVDWEVRFEPQPAAAELVFVDGTRLPLEARDGAWRAQRRIDASTLYRVAFTGSGDATGGDASDKPRTDTDADADAEPRTGERLYRIDATSDLPPRVRALQPAGYLTVLGDGQRSWPLEFEASDDHGLVPTAQLRIIRTEGSGENITSTERTIALRGRGDAKRLRFSHAVDLQALGMAAGDDVIVRLSVRDRRGWGAQTVHSPSFILRWPPPGSEQAGGLDGLVKKTLPAYFRSQRQIIIDAEALLAQKPRLSADTYVERSDAIGVDQRLLRLRYGQFLGEESEGAPILPTNDAVPTSDAPSSDAPTGDDHDGEAADAHDEAAHGNEPASAASAAAGEDGHGHGGEPPREPVFGEEAAVLERFGHTHDHAEAATLLDPETRKLLKAALDEMWQSELNLRQGRPDLALPYANRALAFIKQVQQASRIYLPRVGTELPPVDESRRMGGKREGLGNRGDLMVAAPPVDSTLADAWRALAAAPDTGAPAADGAGTNPAPDLDALRRWLANGGGGAGETGERDVGGDPLALAAAIDRLQREPGCAPCRARLRALLWPMLQRPPAAPAARAAGGAQGRAYLEALQSNGSPARDGRDAEGAK